MCNENNLYVFRIALGVRDVFPRIANLLFWQIKGEIQFKINAGQILEIQMKRSNDAHTFDFYN